MNNITIRNPNETEEARKAVCLEQLAQDRQKMLLRWPFIGGIIMRMELVAIRDDRLSTACTDGDNIFVDINFYSKLTKEERLFVLAHEVWHSVLMHFARRQDRDSKRFNIAADLEIHFTLFNEKMKEPFVLPHDPSWRELSAEEIYEKLPADKNKQSQNGFGQHSQNAPGQQGSKNNSIFGDGQSSFDKHIYDGDKLPEPNSAEESGNGDNAPQENNDISAIAAQAMGNEIVIDKDFAISTSSERVERARSRAIASAQQMERIQGSLPSNIKNLLEKLQKPTLPWQEMLKQFVTTCYGGKRRWLPPSRRHVWQDIYLPSMRDEALKAVVAIDTSGSTQNDLPIFFAELVSLMKSFGKFELDVIQCDAKIQNVKHYSEANLPSPNEKWEVKGFGGTNFCPVFDYVRKQMREQPDLLLFFTDGCGNAPEQRPPYPVMWVLTNDGRQPAHWGRIARFKKNR